MISGTTVSVAYRTQSGTDRFGNPTWAEASESVENVLIAPGATADLEASRPEGVTVAYTLHFPKGYTRDLTGCTVSLPAPWANEDGYRVVGEPRPYMDANTPGAWHMAVEVERAHG